MNEPLFKSSPTELKVAIVGDDSERKDLFARIFVEAGHRVVDVEDAEVVLTVRVTNATRTIGFEELAERDDHPLLTPRELEVLTAIGEGMSNKIIARKLGISLHTVKFHVESLFRKLGVRTRAEAVARGLEQVRKSLIEL